MREVIELLLNTGREPGSKGYRKVDIKDVDIICAGINHQTWYIKVQWREMDMVPKMLEMFEAHPELSVEEKVRIDMLRRFGYTPESFESAIRSDLLTQKLQTVLSESVYVADAEGVVWGLDPRTGSAGSVFDLVRSEELNHRLEVESGVLADESAALLRAFFLARR